MQWLGRVTLHHVRGQGVGAVHCQQFRRVSVADFQLWSFRYGWAVDEQSVSSYEINILGVTLRKNGYS